MACLVELSVIQPEASTDWGSFTHFVMCPELQWVRRFSFYYQFDQGEDGDNSALHGIGLHCRSNEKDSENGNLFQSLHVTDYYGSTYFDINAGLSPECKVR